VSVPPPAIVSVPASTFTVPVLLKVMPFATACAPASV